MSVEINNTLIYFVSRPLSPPADALQTALPSLELSSFLAAVFSTNLADTLRTFPRTTLLIPPNSAFKRLGMLVSAHLLAASSKADLERVIQHHALADVEYAAALVNGSQRTFSTLEGSDVHVDRRANGSVILSASGGWAGMQAQLEPRDLLTQTGVIHEVSDIMIPRSVQLTVGKLVRAAKGTTMATMMTKAGLDWILNGTVPPDGSPWAREGFGGSGWTLLCPTDDAFKQVNLTKLYADPEELREIVSQHLIPPSSSPIREPLTDVIDVLNNNRPIAMDDSATYTTLHTTDSESIYADVVFRILDGQEGTVVGVRGARGKDGQHDWARVLSWGRSTTGGGTGGVVQIDRLLMPHRPPWYIAVGAPIAVGVVGVIAIGAFFWTILRSHDERVDGAARAAVSLWLYGWIGLCIPEICVAFGGAQPGLTTSDGQTEPSPAEEANVSTSGAPTSTTESLKSFLAGGFGGVAAVVVGHPFDLTKTRLQTAAPGTYTGAIDVVKKTIARDGATGLYRGVVPPLLGVTPIFAMSFWAYDMSKALILAATPNRTTKELSIAELATAGFLSAVPTTLVTAPVERAKVLLQVQGQGQGGRQYTGVFDVVKHLYKEGGLRSVFRGSVATVARDGPGSAAYFAAYELTKKMLTPAGASPSELNLGAIVVAGGTAGIAMWSIAIPPDVLKSRIQSAPTGTYSGFMDCARKTIAADGVRALWKGLGPAMARAFPANAATFMSPKTNDVAKTLRNFSASEIAQDPRKFDIWVTHHRCQTVGYSDIPKAYKADVKQVFKFERRLPMSLLTDPDLWTNATEVKEFLQRAHNKAPHLFSSSLELDAEHMDRLLGEMRFVHAAWKALRSRSKTGDPPWSEKDFAVNVYLRSHPIQAQWSRECVSKASATWLPLR
ncbi:hypothetical protein IEO21_00079 [Rhodonia placenta]|uniref:FAS1 domain-containing protein n=1 Tax=Rhodonia placenta TaxID=104341 RepID=A0A8H7PC33_9APHY|nr:hypothetical protein IEO21_00079 [Postia placenta]